MTMRCARLRRRGAADARTGEVPQPDNQTVRNVVPAGPDKTVKLVLDYPMTTGRNLDELPLVIDSLPMNVWMRGPVHRTDMPDQNVAGQHWIG